MSRQFTKEFYLEVAKGNVAKHSLVHKFGAGDVGTTLVPITQSGTYQTPTTAQALEFVSDNVNDTSAGTGAIRVIEHEVGITGNIVLRTTAPKGSFVGPCDIGFMGKVASGTSQIAVDFELLIKDN